MHSVAGCLEGLRCLRCLSTSALCLRPAIHLQVCLALNLPCVVRSVPVKVCKQGAPQGSSICTALSELCRQRGDSSLQVYVWATRPA